MIYLDNAATTVHKPEQVIEAVSTAMRTMGNSSRGTHGSSLLSARTIFEARLKLAEFFGAEGPERVIFTSNSTEALNIAIRGLVGEGDHVITTVMEHNSVLRPLYLLKKQKKVSLSFLNINEKGTIDPKDIEKLIRPETKAIVTTHGSNLTGDMVDISSVAKIAKAHGLIYIVDASQTAGSKAINVGELGIDVLCFTGHKGLLGPQGTGGMILGSELDIRPFKVGGTGVQSYSRYQPEEYPTRLEAGTLNGHGIAGLSAAVDFIMETGLNEIDSREQSLMRRFYDGVTKIDGVRVYGDMDSPRTPIICINIRDLDSGQVADILAWDYDIAVRPGAHCAPLMHEALGTSEQGAVRFSFSYFNTEEEIDTAIKAVREIAEEY